MLYKIPIKYNKLIFQSLGKMGKVIKIYPDGDLRVCVDGQTWTLNPLSVSLLPGSATELNNTMSNPDGQRQDHASKLCLNLLSY